MTLPTFRVTCSDVCSSLEQEPGSNVLSVEAGVHEGSCVPDGRPLVHICLSIRKKRRNSVSVACGSCSMEGRNRNSCSSSSSPRNTRVAGPVLPLLSPSHGAPNARQKYPAPAQPWKGGREGGKGREGRERGERGKGKKEQMRNVDVLVDDDCDGCDGCLICCLVWVCGMGKDRYGRWIDG